MPGLMDYLRLKNIFAPPVIGNDLPEQGGFAGNMDVSPTFADAFKPKSDPYGNIRIGPDMSSLNVASPQDDYDVSKRMGELYTPEHVASDRLNDMVSNYPATADYKPNMLHRIGGALTALSGQFGGRNHSFAFNPQALQYGENLMDRPLLDKQQDWKNTIGPTQNAAQLERQNNINERTMAYQTVAGELRQHAADAKAANDAKKTEIAEHRAQIYEYKAKHPDYKVVMPQGGNIQLINPADGSTIDTGVPTGSMTALDKLNLQQANSMEQIAGRGDQARQTAQVRGDIQSGQIEMRGWKVGTIQDPSDPSKQISVKYNEITGDVQPISFEGKNPGSITKPGTNTSKGTSSELPSQTRVRQFSTARQLANSRPELAKFIKLGPGATDFSIVAPSEGMFGHSGPTKEQYDEINNTIYGAGQVQVQQPTATHAPTNTGNTTTPKTGNNDAKRQQAIGILQKNQKPVTEANIAHVMAQLK